MLECCILFVHHRDDEVTRRHLRSLRDLNPYPVVAACNAAEECVEGALDVAKLSDEGASEPKWEGPDTILYRWFRHGGLRARRYVVLEWDNHATTPVDDFYSEVWDVDAAAANVMRIENEADRHWFGHIDSLPAELRGKACGVVPVQWRLAVAPGARSGRLRAVPAPRLLRASARHPPAQRRLRADGLPAREGEDEFVRSAVHRVHAGSAGHLSSDQGHRRGSIADRPPAGAGFVAARRR